MFQNPKIVLKPETKKRLDKVKVGDESYNSVISRLLEKRRAVKECAMLVDEMKTKDEAEKKEKAAVTHNLEGSTSGITSEVYA